MSDTFPSVVFLHRGYEPEGVDEFFQRARRAYEGGVPAEQFSAEQVRRASFKLRHGGYDTDSVDAALNRLEAAFVQRDRANHVAVNGEAAWFKRVADRATTLYPRLLRPRGERFASPPGGRRGYKASEVDDLLDRLADFFDDKADLTAEQVRKAEFSAAKGEDAYREGPVDAYLGRAVEILLAVG